MTTLQHLTEDHLQDEQTSFQPGSLVNLTALQENVSRLVTSVIFGAKSCEFWGKRNPGGSWEKTSQDSLALNLDVSSGEWSMTWPRWGLVSDGVCMELATLAQSTGATGSSSLPTPRSNSAMAATINPAAHLYPNLETVIARVMLPTPAARDWKGRGRDGQLPTVLLPTPRTSQDHKPLRQLCPIEANGTHGITLVGAIGDALDVVTGGGGVLNPYFVQKMMGFPTGWLD
jgi:hypothetical protein